MKNFLDYKVILWDFDGVIMDSMPIRSNGFSLVLKSYPEEQVKELMDFHNLNGGLSRYVKFRHFFENIRGEAITEEQVQEHANSFSKIMLEALIDENLLIKDSVRFIENNWDKYEMHIVSGSDGNELRQICDALDLTRYFKSINGSPTPKKQLVKNLFLEWKYDSKDTLLIGDSINDAEAAEFNGIDFIAYNNPLLAADFEYLNSFSNLSSSKNV
ncbi:HAD family hydrolase [Pedobacter sp. GR22-6]|uniref:HAD family hydrolase n=1 Tax=Pedobacter sp. GR22-6 TaxID=3127957 RepID=UPI00307FAEFE